MNTSDFDKFVGKLRNQWLSETDTPYLSQFYLMSDSEIDIPIRQLHIEYAYNLVDKHRFTESFIDYIVALFDFRQPAPDYESYEAFVNSREKNNIKKMINDFLENNKGNNPFSLLGNEIKNILNQKLQNMSFFDISKNQKLNYISSLFDLNETEIKILLYFYCASYSPLESFCSEHNLIDNIKILAYSTNIPLKTVGKFLKKDSKLLTSGLLETQAGYVRGAPFYVNGDLYYYLSGIYDFKSSVFDIPDENQIFNIDTFPISRKQKEILILLLNFKRPVNILIYGPPGVGKTEFAKSLIKYIGKRAAFFKHELNNNFISERPNYILHLQTAASLLKDSNFVLVVDEADDILYTELRFNKSKGPLNIFLDSLQVHTIWIVNEVEFLDPSVKRRFDYSLHFSEVSISNRRKIWTRLLSNTDLFTHFDDKKIKYIAEQYPINVAEIKSVIDFIETAGKSKLLKEKDISSIVEDVLASRIELYTGVKKHTKPGMYSGKNENLFNVKLLNFGTDYQKIIRIIDNYFKNISDDKFLTNKMGLRMLFWGIPGTGKTAFAKYIAQKYDKELIIKRVSDILDMFVGQTEKNIRRMFTYAEEAGAILLVDEIDSIVQRRDGRFFSWEITQVNELLTSMEDFSGVSIFTTNRMDLLDKAIIRRFHIKIEFKPLKKAKIREALNYFFPELNFNNYDLSSLMDTSIITMGDIKNVYDKMNLLNEKSMNKKHVIELLNEEISYKEEYKRRQIGF